MKYWLLEPPNIILMWIPLKLAKYLFLVILTDWMLRGNVDTAQSDFT
jgi:hypothetical protein